MPTGHAFPHDRVLDNSIVDDHQCYLCQKAIPARLTQHALPGATPRLVPGVATQTSNIVTAY